MTEAIHVIEGRGHIKARRGHIIVSDRPALERMAGASHGFVEAEYERLIGPLMLMG